MEKKMTKKEMFGRLIDVVNEVAVEDADNLVEFLEKEIKLIEKKKSAQAKTQKENEKLVEVVFQAIEEADKPLTPTEVFTIVRNDEIKTIQKLTALITKLKEAGRIKNVSEKKKQPLYKVVNE